MAEHSASDELLDDEDLVAERLTRGTCLGRYELLLPIAKGGMARVWAARQHGQRGFSKIVAIKTILPHLARDPEFERMFLDEARIASMVHHPNVCEIYELGEEGRALYLAMEWVNGESLAHVLRAGGRCEPLEPRIVARIVSDVCAGLNAAHNLRDDDGNAMDVVHRDVSPHNILLSAGGHVKVADFGVAKALGQHHSSTSTGQLKGKINYMAPEQITGRAIDRRSDVFSLGCVLYEATTGLQPFKGEGDHQVMHRLLSGDFTPPGRLIPGYPPELEAIVMCAMALAPEGRFASADRMRLALEEWLAAGPIIIADTHVAGAVYARVGGIVERRRERIRAAQATSDREPNLEALIDAATPSGRGQSGVKAATGGRGGGAGSDASRSFPPSGPVSPRSSPPSWSPSPLRDASQPSTADGSLALPDSPPSEPGTLYRPVFEPHIEEVVESAPGCAAVAAGGARRSDRTAGPVGPYRGVAAVLGAVMLAALSAIAFFLWRAHAPPSSAPTLASASAPAGGSAPGALVIASEESVPSQTPSAVAPVDKAIALASPGLVTFRVSPESAVLLIDGVEQASGVRAMTRRPGEATTVIVRAPGYEDETIVVDDAFPNKVVVTLSAVHRRRGDVPRKGNDPLPANPY
jgi:serine/threonine protein kinase